MVQEKEELKMRAGPAGRTKSFWRTRETVCRNRRRRGREGRAQSTHGRESSSVTSEVQGDSWQHAKHRWMETTVPQGRLSVRLRPRDTGSHLVAHGASPPPWSSFSVAGCATWCLREGRGCAAPGGLRWLCAWDA